MTDQSSFRSAAAQVLDRDEVEGVLSSRFYTPGKGRAPQSERTDKPLHYKIICISMYTNSSMSR
jgi:hypothetical protein